ncbi:MAG: hypothetical protein ACRECC_09680 [Pseudolabrys sp.]
MIMHRRFNRIVTVVALLAFCAALSACTDFDPENLDVFHLNEKKKLPGERKPLFPEGVPGVSEGVPPELVKGHQPPPEATLPVTADVKPVTTDTKGMTPAKRAALQAAIAPDEKPKPKRKPKPRVVKRAPETKPTQVTVQPKQQAPAQQATGAPAPWPGQQQQTQQQGTQAPWPNTAQQPSSAPWPSSPPPGTFSR